MMAQPVEGVLSEIPSSPSPPSPSSPSASSSLSPSTIVTCSIPPVAFSDKSTNSGLEAGEFFPILHINSKSLTGIVVEGANVVRLEHAASNGSVSKNLTLDASQLFTATIALHLL
jgi:hypothetical protein